MTIADLARDSAISFEAKKDSLRQMQNGDWRVSFTVQGIDMDERITRAAMGTRFVAVLVEINDQELPVTPAAKENPKPVSPATPQPDKLDKPLLVEAKRTWNDFPPAKQAGIRSHDPRFSIFLEEEHPADWNEDAAECIRSICGVKSRAELSTDQRKRVLWHQLNSQFEAWLLKERVGA